MSYVGEIVETSGDNTNLLILSGVSMGGLMALVYSDIPGMFGLPRGAGPGTLRRNLSPYRRIFSFATGGGTGEYARQPPDNFLSGGCRWLYAGCDYSFVLSSFSPRRRGRNCTTKNMPTRIGR